MYRSGVKSKGENVMARDSKGSTIQLGDWVVQDNYILSVIELRESPKGAAIKGACIGFSVKGRLTIVRLTVDPAQSTVIMREDGSLVQPIG